MGHEYDGDTNSSWWDWKGDCKSWKNQDHPHSSIVKIGPNTEKHPGDLSKFAVTLTPVKDAEVKKLTKSIMIIIKNSIEHEGNNCCWKTLKETGGIGNLWKNENHTDHSSLKISKNI